MYAVGSTTAEKEYVVCRYVWFSIEDDDFFGKAYKTENGRK